MGRTFSTEVVATKELHNLFPEFVLEGQEYAVTLTKLEAPTKPAGVAVAEEPAAEEPKFEQKLDLLTSVPYFEILAHLEKNPNSGISKIVGKTGIDMVFAKKLVKMGRDVNHILCSGERRGMQYRLGISGTQHLHNTPEAVAETDDIPAEDESDLDSLVRQLDAETPEEVAMRERSDKIIRETTHDAAEIQAIVKEAMDGLGNPF